jgi:hypothetical protein
MDYTNGTIPPGQTGIFSIDFTPPDGNPVSIRSNAQLEIYYGPNYPSRVFLKIDYSPNPKLSFSTKSLSLQVPNGSGPAATDQVVTLTNSGDVPVSISGINVEPGVGTSTTGDFSETSNCLGSSLAPNASCNIDVTYTDYDHGGGEAFVQIVSNATTSPDTIEVWGRVN